jgi:tripartite-type tricarboxylate transporter receptor subunit TctC
MCDQTTNTTGQYKSGKIKGYAVTTKQRVESLKELPTAAEAGIPGFEVTVWHGVYAPKGTPKPVVDRLTQALQAAIAEADFIKRMADLGSVPVAKNEATPEGLRSHLKAEIDKWTPIIKKAGVYAD